MWPLVSEERTKQADRAAEGTGRTASSLALWPARGETLKGHSVSSTPGFPGGKQVAPVMNPAAAPAASPEEVGSQGAKFNYRPALKRSPKSASSLPFHFKVLSQKRKVKPSACRGGFISRFSASYMPDPQVGAGSKEKWKRKKKSEKKKKCSPPVFMSAYVHIPLFLPRERLHGSTGQGGLHGCVSCNITQAPHPEPPTPNLL